MEMRSTALLVKVFLLRWQAFSIAMERVATATNISEVVGVVEKHHVLSPRRQEMALAAVREIYGVGEPLGVQAFTPQTHALLSQEISKLTTLEEVSDFVRKALK